MRDGCSAVNGRGGLNSAARVPEIAQSVPLLLPVCGFLGAAGTWILPALLHGSSLGRVFP